MNNSYRGHRKRQGRWNRRNTPIYLSIIMFFLAYYFVRHGSEFDVDFGAVIALAVVIGSVSLIVYIIVSERKKNRIWESYLSSSLAEIDHMSGEEFEQWLKAFFESKGYKVQTTKVTGDYGADLVMEKPGQDGKIIVQAKRYSKNIGIEAVQEIVAAKPYYSADSCIVATNRYFTSAAKQLADANDVMLLDRSFFWSV